MLKPKSTLHKRMFKIATVLFDLIFVFTFFFVLSYVLEIVLLKQSHPQLYVAATYYTSIIQKWTLQAAVWAFQALIVIIGVWLVVGICTFPIKNKKLESETK